jgi:Predicted transcriptional regulators
MENRIQELRKDRRMTQEELAGICKVTRQTIISLENGKYNPSIFLAYNVAKAFGLKIEDVFIFEEVTK